MFYIKVSLVEVFWGIRMSVEISLYTSSDVQMQNSGPLKPLGGKNQCQYSQKNNKTKIKSFLKYFIFLDPVVRLQRPPVHQPERGRPSSARSRRSVGHGAGVRPSRKQGPETHHVKPEQGFHFLSNFLTTFNFLFSVKLALLTPGFEPTTSRLQVFSLNH